jgi:hypothetical protein
MSSRIGSAAGDTSLPPREAIGPGEDDIFASIGRAGQLLLGKPVVASRPSKGALGLIGVIGYGSEEESTGPSSADGDKGLPLPRHMIGLPVPGPAVQSNLGRPEEAVETLARLDEPTSPPEDPPIPTEIPVPLSTRRAVDRVLADPLFLAVFAFGMWHQVAAERRAVERRRIA